jgi:hypothetical protein
MYSWMQGQIAELIDVLIVKSYYVWYELLKCGKAFQTSPTCDRFISI